MNTFLIREADLPSRDEMYLQYMFTQSNGAFGALGSSPFAKPGTGGTYIGGVHAEVDAAVHPIPALGSLHRDSKKYPDDQEILKSTVFDQPIGPNIFALDLTWNTRRLRQPIRFTRTLDMQRGLLRLEAEVLLPNGHLTVNIERLAAWHHRHLAAEQIEIVATASGRLDYALVIDGSVRNVGGHDFWALRHGSQLGQGGCFLETAAEGTDIHTCVAMKVVTPGIECAEGGRYSADVRGAVDIRAGEPLHLERFVGIGVSVADKDPMRAAAKAAEAGAEQGYARIRSDHAAAVQDFWSRNDIVIEGPEDDQRALRFCIYQVRSAAPPTPAFSIGPNFLAGPRYRAAAFWDTDVFIIPYYVKTAPELARQHMLYRYRTLEAARAIARKAYGLAGARYPWQAMADGRDALAPWNIFAPNQIHIVADVAWAVADYHYWSGDDAFMTEAGRFILADTARFWMSRMTRTERGLEILSVCGPDETHPTVNNSVFTNLLAQRNLRIAAEHNPDDPEREQWLAASQEIFVPAPREDGVVEQCDGFFALAEPPEGVGCTDGDQYQSVKQADVLMLPVMLPTIYTEAQIEANYAYYEPRTTHESSLSAGIHALVAARLGHTAEAYRQFRNTAFIDVGNVHKNTHKGLHSAASAMAPRAVIEGFGGLRIEDDQPVVTPHLPDEWNGITFGFSFRGTRYRCALTRADQGRRIVVQPEAL